MTRPVPTNQVYLLDSWIHTRQQSPSPGPYQLGSAPTLFRQGLDHGNSFQTDGFPSATVSLGAHFLARESGFVDVKAAFSFRRTSGTQRVRLRLVRNGLYSNSVGQFQHQSGDILSYGPWVDSASQLGLPLSGTALGILNDRVEVEKGDRLSTEAYLETSGASVVGDVIQDPELNFSHFKLMPNF
jgi:hypothetical protein